MIQDLFSRHRLSALTLAGALAACGIAGSAAAADVDVRNIDNAQAAVARALGPQHFAGLQLGESIALRGLPVGEQRLDLELERFTVWADDAEFYIDDEVSEKPGIILLRGTVAGDDSSRVVLGMGEHAINGFIETRGQTFSVSTGKQAGFADADAVRIADMAGFKFEDAGHRCGIDDDNVDEFNPMGIPTRRPVAGVESGLDTRGTVPCRVVRVAIDTDWEWTSERFAGDAQAAGEYALFLVAAISEVYERDVNTRLVVPYLRTFSSNADPYTGGLEPDPLQQVRIHWRDTMQHVDRDLVHLLTGANTSYGGVAYVGAICNDAYGFGVSSYMDGSFPYPLEMNSYSNWDLVVMAHELGHNFGTFHTHDGYEPPLDRCGIDCTGNLNSTIMSYCHICAGGLINIDLRFHSEVQLVMEDYLEFDVPCSLEPSAAANDDFAMTVINEGVDIFVLGNDMATDCDYLSVQSAQSPTDNGGTTSIEFGGNPIYDPSWIKYSPAPNFFGTDTFTYTSSDGQTAQVTVDVLPLIPDVISDGSVGGLTVSYYDIGSVNSMPNFASMTPIEQGVAETVNFPSTGGNAVGSPLSNQVGAVFEGWVRVPDNGLYTFEVQSDDGSILYVADQLVANNDGDHGMISVRGSIALEQGDHAVRIEYYEDGGDAGLIFSMFGPGGANGVVPSVFLVSGDATEPCIADLAEPFGVLDLADINFFVGRFVFQMPEADLAPPFGVWDLADIVAFVESFNSGCP